MDINNNKYRYCKDCHRYHKKNEMISVCPVCNNHANKLYDLRMHNLSLSSVQGVSACESCTQELVRMSKKEDPWISEMMGLTDEYWGLVFDTAKEVD